MISASLRDVLYELRDSKQDVELSLVTGSSVRGKIRNVYDTSFIILYSDNELCQTIVNLEHVVKISFLA